MPSFVQLQLNLNENQNLGHDKTPPQDNLVFACSREFGIALGDLENIPVFRETVLILR